MEIVEELKRLKSLLDEGAISQEEFNRLKQNLLVAEAGKNSAKEKSPQPILHNERKSLLNKKLIILLVFILVSILGVLAITHIELVKEKITGILNKSDIKQYKQPTNKKDIIYEEGKELGVLVIKKFLNNRNTNGTNLHVPTGKMWTPLYYEVQSDCYYSSIPLIFTEKMSSTGWERSSSYNFYEKKEFVSYRVAQRNNRALSGDFAVMCDNTPCKSETFLLYFLEE